VKVARYSSCFTHFVMDDNINKYLTIIIILLSLVLATGIILPMIARVKQSSPPEHALCSHKLFSIGKEILNYTRDHNEAYPDSFEDLMGSYLEPNDLICPFTNNKPQLELPVSDWSSYILVHHINSVDLNSPDSPSNIVVAYCPPENHPDNVAYVLFADFHIRECKKDEFLKLLKESSIKYIPKEKIVKNN